MNAEGLQAIREFLEGLGYEFNENWHEHMIYFNSGFPFSEGSLLDCLKVGLNHYLCAQLGIHWRKIWSIVLGHSHDFEAEWHRQILQAIEYLQALEKGETA